MRRRGWIVALAACAACAPPAADESGGGVLSDARVTAVRESGWRSIAGEDFAAGIGDPEQGYVERMWDPRVQVLQNVATVWAPYDFYLKGEFSHCGVDAFQLVLVDGAWKVQSLLYNTLQPPECEVHPEGPPG